MSRINVKNWLGLALGLLLAPSSYAACNYALSTTNRMHGYGLTTNSVTVFVETNCPWTASSGASWVSLLSGTSGNGTGSVTYAVFQNTNLVGRTGIVTVAGISFIVQQAPAPCNYTLTPTTRTHGYGAVNNGIDVTATPGCSWSVNNTSLWILLTGTTNVVNAGTQTVAVPYSVLGNTTPIQRSANLLIGDQTFVMVQRAAPCLYELSQTNRNHGYAGSNGTNTVSTSPSCSWSIDNTNPWISIVSGGSATGSATFVYNVLPNPNSAQRVGSFMVWDQTFTVFQSGAPCVASIAPASFSPNADPQTNVVSLSLPGGCAWSSTNSNSWVSVFPPSGVGSSLVEVRVAANASMIGRTGTVSLAGQLFTVKQGGANCLYDLSPPSRSHGYGAVTNSFSLDCLSVCSWSVVNTNPWVTVLVGTNSTPEVTNGSGSISFTYILPQNAGLDDRSGTVVVGGQPFSLTQRALGCAANLSPSSRNHGYTGATNTIIVNIAASCSWAVVNTNPWISFLGITNGVGSNTLVYAVAPNPAGVPRSGSIVVNDDSTLITEGAAPCNYTLTPNSFAHGPLQETQSIAVTVAGGCPWAVGNTSAWVTVLSAGSGSGNGTVTYKVDDNLNPASRATVITIDGQSFNVVQSGVTCTYKLSPLSRAHGFSPATNTLTLTVSNPCPWSVVNTNPWIFILAGSTGAGSGTVQYAVDSNQATPFERVGTLVVGGISCVITQRAGPCGYALTPPARAHTYQAASNSFSVTATNGCPWAAATTNPWVHVTAGFTGNGSGIVEYTIDENAGQLDRLGYLAVDGQTFVITQRSAFCNFVLSTTNRSHGYAATTNSVNVGAAPGCDWQAVNTNSWITWLLGTNGSGDGSVSYAVAANGSAAARSGNLVIAGQVVALTQAAYLCDYKLSPTNRTHGFGATTNSVGITAGANCSWTVVNSNSWLTLTSGGSGSGNSNFTYIVAPNYGNVSRSGVITLGDESIAITQLASTNGFSFETVAMGGSALSLRLNGGPPGIWEVQSTRNLSNWFHHGFITNTTGKVEYVIPLAAATNNFYRALLQ